ncbi:hypothetical protein TNCV_1287091 [Trichonephila clavipes]|nr:hypothetical protein TNCV_1287091 [Trichonephila clavipes]
MTNKKLVISRIDHIKDSLKSIGKPLVRKVRGVDHGRVTPHGEIPRNKRKINSTASKDQALKRSKICRKKITTKGSDHQDRKRRAPEQGQGVKRSQDYYDYRWIPNGSLDVITRPVRPERQREDAKNKRRNQSGRIKPIQGDLAHTIYGAVYKKKTEFLKSSAKIEINGIPGKHIPQKKPQYGSVEWRSSA